MVAVGEAKFITHGDIVSKHTFGAVTVGSEDGLTTDQRRERRAHNILFFVFGLILLFGVAFKPILRQIFPVKYMQAITQAAEANGLKPMFVASVVKVESGFNEKAESPKGARGLMQVMPETGIWVAEQMKLSSFDVDMLYEPELNLAVGTWFLQHLQRMFDGNEVIVLAAYNAGQKRVQQWLDEGRWDGREETLDDVPFEETRVYVRRVLTTQDIYSWLYAGGSL